MIQTRFSFGLPDDELEILSTALAAKYKTRYVHPITGEVLPTSTYVKNEKKTRAGLEYFVDNQWVKEEEVPERREWRRKKGSTLEGYFQHFKRKMREKDKTHGKLLMGENEFQDKWNCHDKVRTHFNKQVERYGYRCPITDLKFTTIRNHDTRYDGLRRKVRLIITNISADRILNDVHYTKQNVLFTSVGWNMSRGELSLSHMKIFLKKNHVERYEAILRERFPDYIDEENT